MDIGSSLGETVGIVGVAIVTLALGAQQLLKRWKTGSAENSILTLLHSELERMATQNKLLSSYVNALQIEAVKINSELAKLQVENKKLHTEVLILTNELISMRRVLDKKG
jgi:hypothetical protein